MSRHALDRRAMLGLSGFALGGLALRSASAESAPAGPAIIPLEGHLPPLALHMQDVETGQTVTASTFRGHPVILYFGFTRCPDTCPLTLQNAAKLVPLLGKYGKDLRVVFVTVDLAYDTAARLKTFVAKFGPPPVFTGLRGTPAELKAAAQRFGVYYRAPTGPDSPDPEGAIRHSSATYLFGPNGWAIALLATFPSSRPDLPGVAALIRKTMDNY
ncbi:SCO family protein [Acidiphilium sp. C61]|uniref:SCO family protein n=1 Tax=Acidiphilium sp. C61 TaxID=1671485 RepID=UPI00157B02B6|nr:SCO family protein [Acidiphilium sp. C61]